MGNTASLKNFVSSLEEKGILKTERIKQALMAVPREKFVPFEYREYAYEDRPLPIGNGQTISQPYTVVFMLELLNALPSNKVLDIGAGSGWVSALLSYIVGDEGYVWAYEINETVGEFGKNNIINSGFDNITYTVADASEHWLNHAPYNRVICSAAFYKIPKELFFTLDSGGLLVAPVGNEIQRVKKVGDLGKEEFELEQFFGFSFVPFINKRHGS